MASFFVQFDPATDCECCEGSGRHITGYCGDGCCSYVEWCGACDGTGEITPQRRAENEQSVYVACEYQ